MGKEPIIEEIRCLRTDESKMSEDFIIIYKFTISPQ